MQDKLTKKKLPFRERVDEIFTTNGSGKVKVIEYINYLKVKVMFLDTGTVDYFRADHIIHGRCRDKYRPSVFGVGVVGDIPTKLNGKTTTLYNAWCGMLERCFCPKLHETHPSYKECSISEDWLHLSNFKKFFDKYHKEGYELDKDLLFKGNKVYSEETCCYIPKRLNNIIKTNRTLKIADLPVGVKNAVKDKYYVYISKLNDNREFLGGRDTPEEAFLLYKESKEACIKEQAKLFYGEGKIEQNVYEALLNYEVTPYDNY